MNVVVVNEGLPYPLTAGNRIRTLNLMQRLASRHRVTYVCRAGDAKEMAAATEYLRDYNIEPIIAGDAPTRKRGIGFYACLAANLFSPLPYAVASHRSPAVIEAMRRHAGSNRVDLWQFEWLAYADAIEDESSAPRLLMAHNVESLIWQRYVENETCPGKRAYLKNQWRKFDRFERNVFARSSHIVAVSQEDAALIHGRCPTTPVSVVDNGIDPEYFSSVVRRPHPGRILFMGSLDWRPNLDAIRLLLDSIFPEIRSQEPSATLSIVGRNPPSWLVDRARAESSVELHANVPDVRPYLAESAMMVVPLRIGGGSRLKILEALAAGVPVVSTSVGSEGLRLHHGREIVIADSPQEMASAVVDAIRSPQQIEQMAQRGREVVVEQYDWDVLAARLESVWETCVRPAPAASLREVA